MEKIKKECIIVPVFYYEDENGYIILDTEEMNNSFQTKMEELYRTTKKAKHKHFKEKYHGKEK